MTIEMYPQLFFVHLFHAKYDNRVRALQQSHGSRVEERLIKAIITRKLQAMN